MKETNINVIRYLKKNTEDEIINFFISSYPEFAKRVCAQKLIDRKIDIVTRKFFSDTKNILIIKTGP